MWNYLCVLDGFFWKYARLGKFNLQLSASNTRESFFLQSSGPGSSSTPSSSSASGEAKVWGPQREVEVKRVEGQSLGLSIVGGKVDGVNSGIFVKNVLPDSPAGATGQLFTGDRILQVGNVTLTSSEQKVAVEAIKNSGDPIRLVVQSLQPSSSKVLPEQQLQ